MLAVHRVAIGRATSVRPCVEAEQRHFFISCLK